LVPVVVEEAMGRGFSRSLPLTLGEVVDEEFGVTGSPVPDETPSPAYEVVFLFV
jgi:hypothetical protein